MTRRKLNFSQQILTNTGKESFGLRSLLSIPKKPVLEEVWAKKKETKLSWFGEKICFWCPPLQTEIYRKVDGEQLYHELAMEQDVNEVTY